MESYEIGQPQTTDCLQAVCASFVAARALLHHTTTLHYTIAAIILEEYSLGKKLRTMSSDASKTSGFHFVGEERVGEDEELQSYLTLFKNR